MPILDTNILIRLGAGDSVAEQAIERLRGRRLIVPDQALLEYLAGVRSDRRGALDAIGQAFDVAYSSGPVLLEAADLRSKHARSGRLHVADLWIAAHARANDTYVVTTNKRHFTALGVPAWNYEKEAKPPAH